MFTFKGAWRLIWISLLPDKALLNSRIKTDQIIGRLEPLSPVTCVCWGPDYRRNAEIRFSSSSAQPEYSQISPKQIEQIAFRIEEKCRDVEF
jgi:hypothetical protein